MAAVLQALLMCTAQVAWPDSASRVLQNSWQGAAVCQKNPFSMPLMKTDDCQAPKSIVPWPQWVATALWERHCVRTLRRSLAEVADGARLGDGGALSIGGARISAVYFRAGYSPDDYPSEAEWGARCIPVTLACLVCRAEAYINDFTAYLHHELGY